MKALKTLALFAVLALGIMQTQADQTNLVQNLNLRLFGYKQGDTMTNRSLVVTKVDTVRLDTRQVIRALGTTTGNTFSFGSRLVLVTPMDGGVPAVQVRDGQNVVDVTGFFVLEQTSTSIVSSVLNTRVGSYLQNTYSIQRFELRDAEGFPGLTLHMNLQGLAAQTSTNLRRGPSESLNLDVTGVGDQEGSDLIIQGTISIIGNQLEVVTDGGGGDIPT